MANSRHSPTRILSTITRLICPSRLTLHSRKFCLLCICFLTVFTYLTTVFFVENSIDKTFSKLKLDPSVDLSYQLRLEEDAARDAFGNSQHSITNSDLVYVPSKRGTLSDEVEFQRALERALAGEGSGGTRKLTRRLIRLDLYYRRSRNQLGLPADSNTIEQIVLDQCSITDEAALDFPDCNAKLNWMRSEAWKEHECYAAHGVDGTDCSYLAYLGQIENYCPAFREPPPPNEQSKQEQPNTSSRPQTQASADSLPATAPANGSLEDLLERVLQNPRWSGRRTLDWVRARIRTMWPRWLDAGRTLLENNPFARQQLRGGELRILLHVGVLTRASGTSFAESASRGGPLGELVQWSDLLAALHALGHELVVTTELEDLLLAMTPMLLTLEPCQDVHNKRSERESGFDLIFTDILGYLQLRRLPNFSHNVLKCRIRVLDSFGTEAKFNVGEYVATHQELRTAWGRLDLNPRQFLTMFPHTPDNSFLGVVVDPVFGANSSSENYEGALKTVIVGSARLRVEVASRRERLSSSARPRALIYGKTLEAWSGAGELLEFLHSEMGLELHATVPLSQTSADVAHEPASSALSSNGISGAASPAFPATRVMWSNSSSNRAANAPITSSFGPLTALPTFVHNHGLLPLAELHALYRSVVLFIGMGFPFEGPAPLEAIANGAVFINPRFPVPLSSKNHAFFRGKPTHRTISSQHPFLEEKVGLPHVHTIDIRNGEEIRESLRKILESPQPKPRVPFEMSAAGLLERVFYQLRHGDQCRRGSAAGSVPEWPPSSAVKVFLAPPGQSCAAACARTGLFCELSYLAALNSAHELRIHGIACDQVEHVNEPFLPAFDASARKCVLMNTLPLLHSCADSHAQLQRICPCRDFLPAQTALCTQCRY